MFSDVKLEVRALVVIVVLIIVGTTWKLNHNLSHTPAPAAISTIPASFDGQWDDSVHKFYGTVSGDLITINYEIGESDSLFWKGTFPAKNAPIIKSIGDKSAMYPVLFASTADNMVITFKNNALNFDYTIMGDTMHIHLKRA